MKGFLNLEAIIALITAIAILSLLINSMNLQLQKLETKNDLINAQIDSISCAQISNSIFVNNLIQISAKSENCFAENNKIKSSYKNQKAESKTIAKELSINPKNKSIQVNSAQHYLGQNLEK